ncbi:hypothetical protein BRADI_2g38621v3 [Brachypodium distachyon]|uniref:Uncharacterized protein n=1 Tax=Brachypodium distachyon TaxID=15368 RepID=A0A2K2DCM2_BRADI|nr:hypothetical protein BRADI_2g38621v3 [Brachypodium distachyon]
MEVLMDAAFRRAADAAHPVLAAAEKGDVASLIKLFATRPNAVSSTTRLEKNTALHITASKGHASFVQQFLLCMDKNVAFAFSENNDGDTPLHLAARAGHLEVVELLIKYAAWAMGIDAALEVTYER